MSKPSHEESQDEDRGLERLLSTMDFDSEINKAKGDQGERLFKWFLENDPVYKSKLRKVWFWDDWPGRTTRDLGIDLVAETYEDDLWAIQAKLYDPNNYVTMHDMSQFGFASGSGLYSYRLLIASTDHLGKNARDIIAQQQTFPVGYVLLGNLKESTANWPSSLDDLRPAT